MNSDGSTWAVEKQRRARQRKVTRTAGFSKAPGDLELVQAFLNTAARDRHPDRLANPEDLRDWLVRRGLLETGTTLDDDHLQRGLGLRRDLRDLIRAGNPVETPLLRRLEQAASNGRLTVRFDDGGPSGVGPATGSFDDAQAALVARVAFARGQDSWPRLAICVREGCGRVFFKSSKNSKAKWCTPQCGERVRAARRRARHSA